MNSPTIHIKPRDNYGLSLVLSILGLFMLLMLMLYKLQNSEPVPQQSNGFIPHIVDKKETIYLLTSKPSALLYAKNGNSVEMYTSKIKKMEQTIASLGYNTKLIPANKLSTIAKDAILFVIDAPALTEKTKKALYSFVHNGGNLFFNFTTGFSDEKGNYKGAGFVEAITNLKLNQRLGFASFKENNQGSLFVTPKLLSPFSTYLNNGESLYVVHYDKLPIFNTPKFMKPDLVATSFNQATPPVATNITKSLQKNEAGMGWHGYLGKGKWVYTSLPSYAFYDNTDQANAYKKLLSGIIDYLAKPIITQPYPYIDQKSAVFISEDTEYKFENFQRFADLAKEYKTPVTAFIVAGLAKQPQYKEMMENIAKNPYVEFASHSTSHKQIVGKDKAYVKQETAGSKTILDKYAPQPIHGFRPPREELNDLMRKELSQSGFTYILGATQEHLYPEFDKKEPNLLIIPRHGTDDYSYLVNLDWDQKQIVDQMIKEVNFVTDLNGIYTLSVHTHLFTYSTNIEIMRKFFKYLKQHPKFKPLNGQALTKRVVLAKGIEQKLTHDGDVYTLTIENNNQSPVDNLYIKLFKNPNLRVTKGSVDQSTSTVKVDNQDNTLYVNHIDPKSSVTIHFQLDSTKG